MRARAPVFSAATLVLGSLPVSFPLRATQRLSKASDAAEKYLSHFQPYSVTLIARFIRFIAGAFVAVLILMALLDEDTLLTSHVVGRYPPTTSILIILIIILLLLILNIFLNNTLLLFEGCSLNFFPNNVTYLLLHAFLDPFGLQIAGLVAGCVGHHCRPLARTYPR